MVHDITEDIVVEMAKMEVTRAPSRLVAFGIGSCIVITLYDSMLKVGAMAHAMLPDSKKSGPISNPIKFADLAVDEMIRKMEALGCTKTDLEAKIVGGANMFPGIARGALKTGEDNLLAVKEKLRKEEIILTGEAVGGGVGRSVEFDTATGIVTVRTKI